MVVYKEYFYLIFYYYFQWINGGTVENIYDLLPLKVFIIDILVDHWYCRIIWFPTRLTTLVLQ